MRPMRYKLSHHLLDHWRDGRLVNHLILLRDLRIIGSHPIVVFCDARAKYLDFRIVAVLFTARLVPLKF